VSDPHAPAPSEGSSIAAAQAGPAALGSYADVPLLGPGVNPRPYVSRNRVPLPFWLEPSTPAVLTQWQGISVVERRSSGPARWRLEPGDQLALPAGQPYRLLPEGECVQVLYRVEPRGPERLRWYCPYCDTPLYPHAITPAWGLPQRQYWAAVQAFNTTTDLRLCEYCGALHPPVNLTDLRWDAVAARLEAAAAAVEAYLSN
jgi:3-hydroxyanthranilate 3,4-dioxygenase